MHITIPQKALADALSSISRVVEKRNTIPILGHVALSARGGRLMARGTDLDMEITRKVECEVQTEGDITVPASMLHDIARKLPAESLVELKLDTASQRLTVRSGKARFTIATLPISDFPNIAAGDLSHDFKLPGQTIAAMIEATDFAISTEETRYYLNGIFLHASEKDGAEKLTAVATDGHRLSRIHTPRPAGAAGMPGIIIPRKAVGEILKLAEQAGEETLTIGCSATKIVVTAPDMTFVSKLIDGTFPDYQRVIPTDNDTHAILEADALASGVDRVSTISSERGRAVKFNFDKAALTMSVSNADAGEASETIEADYTAEPFEIGFNARYCMDVISHLGGDTVRIRLGHPGSPTIFEKPGNDDHLIVLMPMRV